MTTRGSISTGAATLALAALGMAGCALPGEEGGGEGEIPRRAADEIQATARTIAEATGNESCEVAHSATTALRRQVDELEGEVEVETYVALGEMVTSIDELLDVECPATGTTSPDEEPEETEAPLTPATPTTPTTTTPEETGDPEDEDDDEEAKPVPPGQADDDEAKPVPPGQADDEPPTGGLDTERREERKPYSKQAKDRPKAKKDTG